MKPCRFLILAAFVAAFTAAAFGQLAQATVSSADTTITFGQSFTPPYYGGSGTGNWQFVIGGYTNWNPQPNGNAGTDDPTFGWESSWAPPGAGSYSFYIAKCGDGTYANSNYSGWWTLTVNKAPMSDPSISPTSYHILVNQSWSGPSMSAPSSNGTGALIWCAAGGNNWTSGSWTPGSPGTYTLYVGQKADANHSGNTNDPAQGNIQVAGATGSVTVVQPGFSWSFTSAVHPSNYISVGNQYNVSVGVNDGGGFPYVTLYKGGGYMAGGWYGTQANTTDYSTGSVGYSANFSDSEYGFSGGDSTSAYVNSLIATSFTFSGGPNFSYDGSSKSVSVSVSPSDATFSTSGTSSATAPGGYTYSASATGSYSGSGSYSWSISSASQATVSIGPASGTVTANQSLQFTASGGSGTGSWVWGGDAAGKLGNPVTVTFTNTGARTVTVYKTGDTDYNDSNTASASITVNPANPPVVTSASATGVTSTNFSYQISATNSPTSYGAAGLPSGVSVNASNGLISGMPTVAGSFNVTLSAANGGGTGYGTLQLTISFSSGDLTTTAYQYDQTNQLKRDGSGQYSPDAEGNVQSTGP